MRCKACNAVWLVSGPDVASPGASSPASSVAPAAVAQDKEESKRAAVIKKGAEREKRDLFGTPADVNGSVKQTLLPPPAFGFKAGARNEDSVLFRVDQLKAAARSEKPASEKTPAAENRTDDEGIIDLRALSSAPPALRPVPLPVAPLFSEPPAVTLEVDDGKAATPTKRTSRWRLVGTLAAAAVLLLGVGFGVALVFKGDEPVPEPIAAAQPPPPQPEAAPPPKVEAPAADEDKSKDEKGEEVASAKETKGKKGKRVKKGKARTTKKAAPAAKPKKPADPCGCKGDFNCILACTARGGK